MRTRSLVAPAAALPCLVAAAWADTVGSYNFLIDRAASGMQANIDASVGTSGTLIGNYSDTIPDGTRTKPGLFGTFGSTENVPVPVQLAGRMQGPVNSDTTGGFSLDVDSRSGSIVVRDYIADFLSAGSINVPITMTIETDAFRTRTPSSTYLGGVPVTLPIGEATVSAFSVRQVGPGVGVLTPAGKNTYTFAMAPLVEFALTFSILGNEFTVPTVPAPLALAGTVVFSGDHALLTSTTPIDFNQTAAPGQAIPQFPLALPTIIPPGSTANLLMDLMLSEITAAMTGTLNTRADGLLVPGPGVLAAFAFAGATLRRRRR